MMVGIIVTRKLHQTTRADATSDAIDETMRQDLEPRQGFKCGRTGRKVFPMSEPLQVVNPTTIAELSGRFEPVGSEIEAADLPNKRKLPRDLVGAYLRNGPNPRFTPLGSYTCPLEGDAMIHGLWLEGGHARYANSWVHTKGMGA